jgi:hypothetical protein
VTALQATDMKKDSMDTSNRTLQNVHATKHSMQTFVRMFGKRATSHSLLLPYSPNINP